MTWTPERKREYHRQYMKDRYRNDPEFRKKVHALQDARKKRLQQYVTSLKTECKRCGENNPACLDFHHTDPSEKEVAMANIAKKGWSKARIDAEFEKCEVLCANCHRKHHALNAGHPHLS